MKALQITGYGEVRNNLAFKEIEKPKINEDQVLIEVYATSTNPIDFKIVDGALKPVLKLSFPTGIGYDVSGIVRKKGKSVNDLQVGDAVFSSAPQHCRGTFAEFVAIDALSVGLKPTNLNFEEAAALPMVGLTSIQALAKANLKAGDRVLILAGSGGIGSFAIQYAKSKGAYVYTTTSTTNVIWVKTLGADRVFDYTTENYLDLVKDLDVVLDTLGGHYTIDAFKVIRKGGRVITLVGPIDDESAKEMRLSNMARLYLYFKRLHLSGPIKRKSAYYRHMSMIPNHQELSEIKKLTEEGIIKPIIDRIFPFTEAIEALTYQKSGKAKGKIIIKMK